MNKKEYKCYHHLTRKRITSIDVTLAELVPFFSQEQTPLQGEGKCESASTLPFSIPSFFFDSVGGGKSTYNEGSKQGEGKPLAAKRERLFKSVCLETEESSH